MKELILLTMVLLISSYAIASQDTVKVQKTEKTPDTTQVKILDKSVITVIEGKNGTQVKIGDEGIEIITDETGDTTKIKIGKRIFRVDGKNNQKNPENEKSDVTELKPHKSKSSGSFNAHWAGLEFGVNLFHQADYSLYNGNEFMELIPGKSITFNLNFAEWAFKNERKTFGVVTGMGLSSCDYAFDRDITIAKESDNGKIVPVAINPDGLKKTKLNVLYLTAPLLLEIKTPLKMGSSRLYLSGGVIGGLNIASHTKIKYRNDKEKSRGNFNLNPFKYELTGRIGFGDFCIFANYGLSPLFKDSKGPELYPLTVGFTFLNF